MAEQVYKVETHGFMDGPNDRPGVLGYAVGNLDDIRTYYLPKRHNISDELEVIRIEITQVTPQMAKETEELERIISEAQVKLQAK